MAQEETHVSCRGHKGIYTLLFNGNLEEYMENVDKRTQASLNGAEIIALEAHMRIKVEKITLRLMNKSNMKCERSFDIIQDSPYCGRPLS